MRKLLVLPYTLLSLAFTLICVLFVNWWAPIFADEKGWLPNWLAWVQTFDDTLDAGARDGIYPRTMPRYLARVMWLYRNTAYGFEYWPLGIPFDASEWLVVYTPASQGPLTFFAVGPKGAFNWYGVRFGIKWKLGWKAWNMFEPATRTWKTTPWGPEWRIPFTFSISRAK